MKIVVDETCLKEGVRCDCGLCPVALAFRAAGIKATVGTTIVTIGGQDYDLPPAVIERIDGIDNARNVQPFEFDFSLEAAGQLVFDL
jgi:hypothetical protein